MDGSLNFFRNSIHTVKQNLPELVWKHYNEKVSDAIGKMNLTQSKRNSYRQTFRLYADGVIKGDVIYKFNYLLKTEVLKVWPVAHEDFFHGDFDAMELAAVNTAKAMVVEFEEILEAQKLKLQAV